MRSSRLIELDADVAASASSSEESATRASPSHAVARNRSSSSSICGGVASASSSTMVSAVCRRSARCRIATQSLTPSLLSVKTRQRDSSAEMICVIRGRGRSARTRKDGFSVVAAQRLI